MAQEYPQVTHEISHRKREKGVQKVVEGCGKSGASRRKRRVPQASGSGRVSTSDGLRGGR